MSEDEFDEELTKNLSKDIKENFKDDVTENFPDDVPEQSKSQKSGFKKIFENDDENYDLITDISDDDYEPKRGGSFGKLKLFITIAASAAIAIIVIVLIFTTSTYKSIYDQGVAAFESEKYDKALELFQKAQQREEGANNAEISKYIADCYINLGRQDEAMETYNTILAADPNNASAVYGLCEIYKSKKDAESINKLLEKYEGTGVTAYLEDFIVPSPEMDPKGGVFNEETSITMKGAPDCPIFYTTDGSNPTVDSPVYTKPIALEEGVTLVKAMSVDKMGVKSYVNTQEFILEGMKPSKPVFSLESGVYINGQKLEITTNDKMRIYYTYNRTAPTRSSYRYYNPITLYRGTFTISAITYDEKGNASDVVFRDYCIVEDESQIEAGKDSLKRYQENMNRSDEEKVYKDNE